MPTNAASPRASAQPAAVLASWPVPHRRARAARCAEHVCRETTAPTAPDSAWGQTPAGAQPDEIETAQPPPPPSPRGVENRETEHSPSPTSHRRLRCESNNVERESARATDRAA